MQKNLYQSQFGFKCDIFVMHKNEQGYAVNKCPSKEAKVKLFLHICLSILHFFG